MSGRCRACNTVLTEIEMCQKWPGTEEYCDLCNHCLGDVLVDLDDEDMEVHCSSMDMFPDVVEYAEFDDE